MRFYLGFMKMNLRGVEAEQKKRICGLVYQVSCEEKEDDIERAFDWDGISSDDDTLMRTLSRTDRRGSEILTWIPARNRSA